MASTRLNVECDDCGIWWDIVLPRKAGVEKTQIQCIACRKRLSLSQAAMNFLLSDNVFAAYEIRSSWHERGKVRINVGQSTRVEFRRSPARVLHVFISPDQKVKVESSGVTKNGFMIVSSKLPSQKTTSTRVGWLAVGEAEGHHTVPWRQALADSKGYELRKDSNMQIVTAETAFELFVDDFLSTRLKLKHNTIRWVQKRSIEEKVSIWYGEAVGQSLPSQFKQEYSHWQRDAKELRDSIVHRRCQTTLQRGKAAFKAVIYLVSRIDPKWFLNFLV